MFKLDNALLEELGLGSLPAEEKNRMLAHIYETLEMRVGMKLAEQMTNEQLDEFEGFIDRNDEAGALKWLETNFPNYKQVVAEELDKLKAEVRTAAPQIVAASQHVAASAAVAPPVPAQPPYPQPASDLPPAPAQPSPDQPVPQQQYPQPPQYPAAPPPMSAPPTEEPGQQSL
jgi:hypothetical protein